MVTTEINEKLEALNERYQTDFDAYRKLGNNLVLYGGWQVLPNGSWMTTDNRSGSIFEKEINPDYKLEMTGRIEVRKIEGNHDEVTSEEDELPRTVTEAILEALDGIEKIMDQLETSYLECLEAKSNG